MIPPPPGFPGGGLWPWIILAAGGGSYVWGWRQLQRRWLITGMPRARVRSVAMGLAELGGKGRPPAGEAPHRSPVRQLACVWFRVVVTRSETDTKGRESTVTVLRQELGTPFDLDDGTGRLLVLPAGAECAGVETCDVESGTGFAGGADVDAFCLAHGIPWTGMLASRRYRIREWVILADADVTVVGQVARVDAPAADRQRRVVELLRTWAASPEDRKRFDANGDGILQPEEWDAARTAAEAQALQESMAAGAPAEPVLVLRRPEGGLPGFRPPFLIAAGGSEDLLRLTGHPFLWIAGAIAAIGVAVAGLPGGAAAAWSAGVAFAAVLCIGVPAVFFLTHR